MLVSFTHAVLVLLFLFTDCFYVDHDVGSTSLVQARDALPLALRV